MRILGFILIEDSHTFICSIKCSNRPLAAALSTIQLTVSFTSLMQHVFSVIEHQHIFLCRSNIAASTPIKDRFLAYDLVIYDFGLMHRILGTTECVANYMDGGYMRFLWCLQQIGALSLGIMSLLCIPRPIWLLWPVLFVQSSYALGLSILTMAVTPKILHAFSNPMDLPLIIMFIIYFGGFILNWFLTFVLWHYYWFIENQLLLLSGHFSRRPYD